jgi:hypothetical protein
MDIVHLADFINKWQFQSEQNKRKLIGSVRIHQIANKQPTKQPNNQTIRNLAQYWL